MLFQPPVPAPQYPVRFEADYPERLSRLSSFFRIILAIPLLILVGILGGYPAIAGISLGVSFGLIWGILFVHWLAVLIRGRPVGWLFAAIVAIERFVLRANAYILLMSDRYPPFEGDWPVRYEVDQPERLQRRQVLIWKTIVTIPHFFVLTLVSLFVGVIVFIAWFAILFTGRYPRGLYDFVAGWLRWYARTAAYWMSLTDVFPAFSFTPETGRGGTTGYVVSAVIGGLLFFGGIAGLATLIAWPVDVHEQRVSYDRLLSGRSSGQIEVAGMLVSLDGAEDPYETSDGILQPASGRRLVLFFVSVLNFNKADLGVDEWDFRLKDTGGRRYRPVLVTVDGVRAPQDVDFSAAFYVLFEIRRNSDPSELTFTPQIGFKEQAKFILTD